MEVGFLTKISAYTLDSLQTKLKEVFRLFMDENKGFHNLRREFREELKLLVKKYPNDTEVGEFLNHWLELRAQRKANIPREEEKICLVWLLSEFSHIVEWRKLGMSSGRVLPFKNFRSLRGDVGKRGY
jgi:hypothetical protein